MQGKLPVPIGRTNYKKICDNNYYVDKTLLIKDLLDDGTDIILFTRPRRFGKTLNMDMLRTFFEKTAEDNTAYFQNKKIWQQGEKYIQHQGKYPVIYLSLKDIKALNWSSALELLKYLITTEYARHQELATSSLLTSTDADFYQRIITRTATESDYKFSLEALSRMLHMHYKKAPVIIIDEYDTPIQEGFLNGYYAEAVDFIRNFFSAAFKDNPHITLCVLTGILRIAKESIFSGLNNIQVYSVLQNPFNQYFGFTTEEVQNIAQYYEKTAKISEIKDWYDGYQFGNAEIYNPWSVLNYFKFGDPPQPYWVQTSGNNIIHEIIRKTDAKTYDDLRKLITGEAVTSVIDTNIIYPNLNEPQADIFGFLLMTGYIKATQTTVNEAGATVCQLSIPNKEIKSIYKKEILSHFSKAIGSTTVYKLEKALLDKDIVMLKSTLNDFLMNTISYYDGLKENYYHGLLLGLVTILENNYKLTSNRESGNGRYDIQLAPKEPVLPGIIIEIKVADKSGEAVLKQLAHTALKQIEEKKYDTELRLQGVDTIYKYGIAFYNKNVEIVTN